MKKIEFINYTSALVMVCCTALNVGLLAINAQLQFKGVVSNEAIIEELTTRVTQLEQGVQNTLEQPTKNDTKFIATVYNANELTLEPYASMEIGLCSDLTMQEKLEAITEALETYVFKEVGISVIEIKEIDGEQIARINLQDQDRKWSASYFQGSTGGMWTHAILTYSLLQPDFIGDWVDGIKFYYNDEPIQEYDHINLTDTFYRSQME